MVVKSTQVKSLIFSLSLTLVLICSILSVRNAESSPSQLTVRENYRRWVEERENKVPNSVFFESKALISRFSTSYKKQSDIILLRNTGCGSNFFDFLISVHPKLRRTGDNTIEQAKSYTKRQSPADTSAYELQGEPLFLTEIPMFASVNISFNLPKQAKKVVVLLCDPVQRAIAEFQKQNDDTEFQRKIQYYLEKTKSFLRSAKPTISDYEKDENDTAISILTSGIYYFPLMQWMKFYKNGNRMLVIDGERELFQNPTRSVEKLQDFLDVPRSITSQDLEINKKTKTICLSPHLLQNGNKFKPVCSKATRQTLRELDEETKTKLINFYRPYNEILYRLVQHRFPWQ